MAITISGENNNDRILAADGVIDQISGINIVGLITASHINVGSNIQLGNAGIITATTFVGNVTGNVNSTSPLLLQTGGSERFRITGNNELGIAGANYGSSGQVLTSGGSGSAVSWTTIPTQVTIANNGNDRIITGGSGTNLNGEANLQFDGTNLFMPSELRHLGDPDTKMGFDTDTIKFETAGGERLRIMSGGKIKLGSGGDVVGSANVEIRYDDPVLLIRDTAESSADGDAKIAFGNNTHYPTAYISHTWDGNDGSLTFHTRVGGSEAERLRVKSDGTVSYRTGGGKGYEFNSSGSSASVAANVFAPASYTLAFGTNGNERLRITSTGNIGVAGATGTDFSLLDGMVINTANGSAGLIINSSSSSHNAYMSFGYGSGSGTSHNDQYSAYIGRVGDNNLIFGTNNSIRASIDSSGVFNLNNIVQVGTTNDTGELRIGHDGSNYRARIVSNSSNSLEIDADGPERIQMHGGVIYMRPINSEKSAAFVANGSAELYYDDVKKFQTNSGGSQVFGTFQSTPQNNSQKGAYFGPYVIDNSQSAQTDDTVDIRSLKGVALDLTRYYTSGDIQTFRINNDYEGAIYVSPTGVNYNSTSDYRLKENVINLTGAIDRVKQLKPKRFNFIKDPGNTIDGFMAHEVSSVVPNAVIGEKDATMTTYYDEGDTIPDGKVIGDVKENDAINPQSMDDSRLVPLLTAALQEAIARIEALEGS